MSEFRIADPFFRKIVHATAAMAAIALAFYTFGLMKTFIAFLLNVLSPFLTALLLAYILAPVVIQLQRGLKLGRIFGTLLLYAIIFLIAFILLAFLIPTILDEFAGLFETVKAGLPKMLGWMSENTSLKVDSEFLNELKKQIEHIEIDYQKMVASVLPTLKKLATGGFAAIGGATKGIFIGASSVIDFFSFFVFVGIIGFYFIIDWEKVAPLVRKMIPPEHRDRTFDVLEKCDTAVGGFLRGQLTVSLIVGAMFAVGLFCMGFIGFPVLRNYSVLIGTAAGIAGFVPYLGAVIGVAPAVLIVLLAGGVAWSTKLITLGAVFALFGLIQAVEGFVLQPRIVGKGAGLHPLFVMLALIVGSQFGIGGMVVAVPLASIVRVLVREFYWLPIEERERQLQV